MASIRTWFPMVLACVTIVAALQVFPGQSQALDTVVPGILTPAPYDSCTVLSGGSYGTYYLENYGAFAIGDTVVAIAKTVSSADCGHQDTYDLMLDNEILPYRGFDFGCGRLVVDEEYLCGALWSDRFGVVGLATYHGFSPGDSIHVTGDLMLDCASIPECSAFLCLARNTVAPCLTPVRVSTWGSIRRSFR